MSSTIIHADSIMEDIAVRIKVLLNAPDEAQTAYLPGSDSSILTFFKEYFHVNPWFTPDFIRKSLKIIYAGLISENQPILLNRQGSSERTIAVILNPGAPFEGMGEVLFTALSGYNCLVKVPDDSRALFERIVSFACGPSGINNKIVFSSERLPSFDGVIGVNTFEKPAALSYITKRPNLLISQKGSAVTLSGTESSQQLELLASDICNFYGKSNFSIKTLNVPAGYDFTILFKSLEFYNNNSLNHRYFNHYEYHKAVMLISNTKHLDNGFLLLTNDLNYTGKTGVITYQEYDNSEELNKELNTSIHGTSWSLDSDIQGFTLGVVEHEKRFFYNSGRISVFLAGL
ncbi:MAG: hypothetical protein HGA37_01740 [Lentimicrobium sp.]|nr:hypothetical protein [Lentimicrobium sp.]